MSSKHTKILETYTAFRALEPDLRECLPGAAVELDLLIDAVEEEILSIWRPTSMDVVRFLPEPLHERAIGALLDEYEAGLSGDPRWRESSLDWHRSQIAGRPDNVSRLVGDSSVRTAADVLRWLVAHSVPPKGTRGRRS